jgi:hypothetical protein
MSDKALSVQQPWAWLIVNGYKPVENRDWPTNVRGEIAIHAGKTFDTDGYLWVRATSPEIPLPRVEQFEKGGIVGRAVLADCVSHLDSLWFFGRYGFVFTNPRPMPLVPCRGMLGFFTPNVPAHV